MARRPDEETIAFAHRLADAAGEVIRPFFRAALHVTDKGKTGFDPVTEADKGAEQKIRTLIKWRFPADGVLGEEEGETKGTSGRCWVIDPIDGTRAFITGRHTWGSLIALTEEDVPVLGIIDQPVLRERFIGYEDCAEYRSPETARALKTRVCGSLKEAAVSTTHPWGYFDRDEQTRFADLCASARSSHFGGDCYGYGLLAMGFVDLVVESGLNVWDVAALIPIVENAGGIITNWQGGSAARGGSVIAAGDARVHAEALSFLSRTG